MRPRFDSRSWWLISLVAIAASAAPAVGEEHLFHSDDHKQQLSSQPRLYSASSGNIWAQGTLVTSFFDGLVWRNNESVFEPMAQDDRGALWSFFQSGIGRQAVQVDPRSGRSSAFFMIPGSGSAPVHSVADSAFLTVSGNEILSYRTISDPFVVSPAFVAATVIDGPVPDQPYGGFTDPLHRLNDGQVWLRAVDGWYRRGAATWDRIDPPVAPPLLVAKHTGVYWAARGDTVMEWREGSPPTMHAPGVGLAVGQIRAILEDATGHVWAQGRDGLAIRTSGGWLTIPAYAGLPAGTVRSSASDYSGHLWSFHAGSNVGLELARSDANFVVPLGGNPPPVLQTRDGRLISTRNDSVFVRRGGDVRPLPGEPGTSQPIHEDQAGRVWFATPTGDLLWLDGLDQLTLVPGPPGGLRLSFALEDEAGALWFQSAAALHHLDGALWSSYSLPEPPFRVTSGRAREVWAAFPDSGLRRFDTLDRQWNQTLDLPGFFAEDTRLITLFQTDPRGSLHIGGSGEVWIRKSDDWSFLRIPIHPLGMTEDPRGQTLLFGDPIEPGEPGVIVLDANSWSPAFPPDQGSSTYPHFLPRPFADSRGEPWFFGPGTIQPMLAGFSDVESRRVVPLRLSADTGDPVFLDVDDQLWFNTHVVRLDRTPPVSVILNPPARRVGSAALSLTMSPMIESATDVQYRTREDSGPWSLWNSSPTQEFLLSDGPHCIEIQSRDRWGNIEPMPQEACFTVDSSPPLGSLVGTSALITGGDTLLVVGTVDDEHLASYRVRVSPFVCGRPDTSRAVTVGPLSKRVAADTLATFPGISAWGDGRYLVELIVNDDLGLIGATQLEIMLDRVLPTAEETSPSFRTRAHGGTVYAEGGGVSIAFPPLALENDAVIQVDQRSTTDLGLIPPGGTEPLGDAVLLSWQPPLLRRGAILSLLAGSRCDDRTRMSDDPGLSIAAYRVDTQGRWERLGGTRRAATAWIDVLVEGPGTYVVLDEATGPGGGQANIGPALHLTPRVMRTGGTGNAEMMVLSFMMDGPGAVSGFVHDRAGRLVRTLARGASLDAGIQSLRWDARDDRGDVAIEGLYIITVQTPFRTLTQTCVVRGP